MSTGCAWTHTRCYRSTSLFKYLQKMHHFPESALIQEARALQEMGCFAQAVSVLEHFVRSNPDHAEALSRLGWLLTQLGRLDDAIAMHRKAIEVSPQFASAWSNLGIALQTQGQHEDALRVLQHSVSLAPEIAESHVNLGIEWQAHGMHANAISAFRHAIALKPSLAEAWINLAIAFLDIGEVALARATNRQALTLQPGNFVALSNLQMCLQYASDLTSSEIKLNAALAGAWYGSETAFQKRRTREGTRLKIGYVSADLYAHPIGWMMTRVLAAHDQESFEVYCYADQLIDDFLTKEIHASVEHWHPVRALSHDALQALIQSHGIDVLIDLSGHTARNRLPTFARRAAPTQLAFLGFAASTGIAAMDGVILAESMAPEGVETGFTEQIHRLPCCPFSYRPPDYAPPIAAPPNISNGFITFGSFNNLAKMGPEVVSVWARILQCVPNSRLILKARSLSDPTIANLIRHRFKVLGVEPSRLDFRGPSSHAELLAQYGDMDIALDTFPFCGGLTTCEALWMGVPVVTLPWLRPMSRQGSSLLQAVGLDSLVAATPREYAANAIELANDVGRIQELRSCLRKRVETSALFDGAALALALERVYVQANQISHREAS